jgi:ABC-type nitrate/sulfonate/bicarbonate transport system permease component
MTQSAPATDTMTILVAERRKRNTFWQRRYKFYPLAAIVIIVIAWQIFVSTTGISIIYLPAPLDVVEALGRLVTRDALIPNTVVTLERIYVGFAVASVIAIAGGLLMNVSRGFRSLADAFIAAFYPLPKIALIPILIIWLGSGESYKIVISAISAFFPIIVNTYLGVRHVDRGLIKTAKDLGLTWSAIQRKVIFPSALPSILAGLHLGLGIAVVMVVAAEMVAGQDGLGYMLLYSGQIMETESVFALLIVLTVLGWVITKVQKYLDRFIAPWAATSNEN